MRSFNFNQTWSDELANLCSLNVKSCVMAHDSCIATKTFEHPGQNLYATANNGAGYFSFDIIVNSAIEKGWYAENLNALRTDTDMCCKYGK